MSATAVANTIRGEAGLHSHGRAPGPHIQNIRSERDHIAQLEPWHQMIESSLAALLDEALRPLAPDRHQKESTRALIDLATWQAF